LKDLEKGKGTRIHGKDRIRRKKQKIPEFRKSVACTHGQTGLRLEEGKQRTPGGKKKKNNPQAETGGGHGDEGLGVYFTLKKCRRQRETEGKNEIDKWTKGKRVFFSWTPRAQRGGGGGGSGGRVGPILHTERGRGG